MEHDHTIGTLRIRVRAFNRKQALQCQHALGFQLHTQAFMQQLETLLNRIIPADRHIEIPQLKLEFSCVDENAFNGKFFQTFEHALLEKINASASGVSSMDDQRYEKFVQEFFLKYGICPSSNGKATLLSLQSNIRNLQFQALPELENMIMSIGQTSPMIWKRLLYILDTDAMRIVLIRFLNTHEKQLEACESLFHTEEPALQNLLKEPPFARYLAATIDGRKPDTMAADGRVFFHKEKAINRSPFEKIRNKSIPEKEITQEAQGGFPINNAGLVLLWRMFQQLLRSVGYIADKQFINAEAQQRAIWLLHYIATGSLENSEEELLLNKILCAWPEDEPVNPEFIPDAIARHAARDTLQRYIDDWKKDRVFSLGWFRTAFLKRQGRLSRRMDGNWQLEVDKRTEDILIDKASVVKYPWMSCLLFVKW